MRDILLKEHIPPPPFPGAETQPQSSWDQTAVITTRLSPRLAFPALIKQPSVSSGFSPTSMFPDFALYFRLMPLMS